MILWGDRLSMTERPNDGTGVLPRLRSLRLGSEGEGFASPVAIVLVFAFFVFLTWVRFRKWEPSLFYGDDLFNYMLYHGDRFQSYWGALFFSDTGQKFRFVFSALMRLEIFVFGRNIGSYFLTNVVIHSASATTLYVIANRLSRNWWAAILLATLGATSHLAVYEVTQATGQVESLGLLFCMLMILSVLLAGGADALDAEQTAGWRTKYKWSSLVFAFLAFNSHERYIVLLPWLMMFFVLHGRAGSIKPRVAFFCTCAVLVITNFLIKRLVYHSNFFQGTGGQPLAFNAGSVESLLSEAVLSIVGVNHGPQYLTGAEWMDFSPSVRLASISFAITCIGVAGFAFACEPRRASGRINWPSGLVVLIGLLLLPATLTIRMEQRWELAPFFLGLLIVARGLNRLAEVKRGGLIVKACCLVMCVSAAVIEIRISRSLDVVSYLSVDRFARSVKENVVDTRSSEPGAPLVFVASPGYCIGILLDGGFFVVYEGMYRKVTCVNSIADAPASAYPDKTRIYEWLAPNRLVDATSEWR